MTKLHSSLDAAIETVKSLQELISSSGKEAFRKQVRESERHPAAGAISLRIARCKKTSMAEALSHFPA
jgi:hypothetical protein